MVHVARAAILLASVFVLAGCGSDEGQEKSVATAGDLRVTLADFHDAYNKITPNYRPDITTLEGKRQFANDLVNREILLAEGRRMGGITDPAILANLERNEFQTMLGVLYREQIEAQVEVLGRDVAEVYEHRKNNVVASHILFNEVSRAREVRASIVAGDISFEDAASEYSLDQRTKLHSGSMGPLIWAMTMPPHQKMAFEMTVGEISEPVETAIGIHLIRLDERLPQELAPLEEMRPALRSDVRRQLEGLKMREYVAGLEQQANLTWNNDGIDVLREIIAEGLEADIDTIPPERQYVPNPTPEQRSIVLARYSGREWTVGDYTDHLASQPTPNRPVALLPTSALKELIRTTQLQTELLRDAGVALGLDQRPEVAESAQRLRDQILVELVHSRFIQAADVPEEDVRAVYDSTLAVNPDALMIPERVDMYILVHTEEGVVREALARIARGDDEETVCSEVSLDFRTATKGGRTGLVARGNYAPQIEDIAFSGRVGKGWTEAIVTESGTGALKVVVHEESRIATFDEMLDPLTRQLAVGRGEQAFEEWLQAERASRGIEIHDEVLELIGQSVS